MKVGLCQINTTQGDLPGNAERIATAARAAREAGADVAVFPELALCGYCPRDLLLTPAFLAAVTPWEERLGAALPRDLDVLVGSVRPNESGFGRPLLNVSVHFRGARALAVTAKRFLPNYDVFDESRYFASAAASPPVDLAGSRCGVTICEDIWSGIGSGPDSARYEGDPPAQLVAEGAQWLANLSASPYRVGRPADREDIIRALARRLGRPVVLVNLVGGNDEVLFDGHSLAVDAAGRIIGRARGFEEDLLVLDLDQAGSAAPPTRDRAQELDELARALVMGVRDYARKTGFSQALLGLSGGIDSALTAVIAADALGPENVLGVAMPSRYSEAISETDAAILAQRLGIAFEVLPIGGVFDGFVAGLTPTLGGPPTGLTEENLQPRIRGTYLMALSNARGHLLLSTGNKSELAVGYCTLYGDLCGGLAVISDLPKTLVYELSRHINHTRGELIPQRTIDREPTAELRPDQRDTDSLPPYDVLDEILHRVIAAGEGVATIVAAGFDEKLVRDVIGRVWRNEYKRKQMPPGLRVTSKAFGIGRRMPIAGASTWIDAATGYTTLEEA